MEMKSSRRHYAGGIVEEKSFRRNHGGQIIEEESWRGHLRSISRLMEEDS